MSIMTSVDPVIGPLPDRFEANTMIESELAQHLRFDRHPSHLN